MSMRSIVGFGYSVVVVVWNLDKNDYSNLQQHLQTLCRAETAIGYNCHGRDCGHHHVPCPPLPYAPRKLKLDYESISCSVWTTRVWACWLDWSLNKLTPVSLIKTSALRQFSSHYWWAKNNISTSLIERGSKWLLSSATMDSYSSDRHSKNISRCSFMETGLPMVARASTRHQIQSKYSEMLRSSRLVLWSSLRSWLDLTFVWEWKKA